MGARQGIALFTIRRPYSRLAAEDPLRVAEIGGDNRQRQDGEHPPRLQAWPWRRGVPEIDLSNGRRRANACRRGRRRSVARATGRFVWLHALKWRGDISTFDIRPRISFDNSYF